MTRTMNYDIPDEDIVGRFGSLEKFKHIVMSCSDACEQMDDEPASDEEKQDLQDFVASYDCDSKDEDVWTDREGNFETSYEEA